MNRRSKGIKEIIKSPKQLEWLNGWEVRKIYTERPAIVLQNPDSGQKVKLVIDADVFYNGSLKVLSRKGQLFAKLPIDKRESEQ